jgi:hypothetical protein
VAIVTLVCRPARYRAEQSDTAIDVSQHSTEDEKLAFDRNEKRGNL